MATVRRFDSGYPAPFYALEEDFMARSISSLPPSLQGVARRVDALGNKDEHVAVEEVSAGKLVAQNVSTWSDADRLDLERLGAVVGSSPPSAQAATVRVGPGGLYESTLYPPVGGFQREVIRFATFENPEGLRLDGTSPLELPGVKADGVVGVRLQTGGASQAMPSVTVGGKPVAPFTGEAAPGTTPLHGKASVSAHGPVTLKSVELVSKVPSAVEDSDYYPVFQTVRAGETVDIDLSRYRKGKGLDQIELMWTARYDVPDPSGRRTSEGKPRYLDGVYADVFLVDAQGVERPIGPTKFVDEEEVDNCHDLGGPKGDTLRIKFFAKNPAGEGQAVTFRGVRMRYLTEASTPPATFTVGKVFQPGERCEVELPPHLRDKKIGRVDVRWTDMLSGTWERPGYAQGTLIVDGKPMGPSESVQSPETQSSTFLNGAKATLGKVGVQITSDRAQVDWIKVYFED